MLLINTLFILLATYGTQCFINPNGMSKVNEQELDRAIRQIQPFGDPEFSMAHDKDQLTGVCNVLKTRAMGGISHLLRTYGTSEYAVTFVNQMTLFASMLFEACTRLLNPANDGLASVVYPMYKEISDTNGALRADRDGLTRALIDAAQPDTKARLSTVLCYLSKWVDTVSGAKVSDGAKNMIKAWLHGFDQYVINSGFIPSATCDWSGIPEPAGGPQLRSVPMLMVQALANVNKFSDTL